LAFLRQKQRFHPLTAELGLNENGISWICESVGEDLEKTKFAWGVKGLPWLILTDEKHVVLSEGLTLAQLDEALKKQDER
jgi:hypothetical protein